MNANLLVVVVTLVVFVLLVLLYVVGEFAGFLRFLKAIPAAMEQRYEIDALHSKLRQRLETLNAVPTLEIPRLAVFCIDRWVYCHGNPDHISELVRALREEFMGDEKYRTAVSINAERIAQCTAECFESANVDSVFGRTVRGRPKATEHHV